MAGNLRLLKRSSFGTQKPVPRMMQKGLPVLLPLLDHNMWPPLQTPLARMPGVQGFPLGSHPYPGDQDQEQTSHDAADPASFTSIMSVRRHVRPL